VSSKPEVTIPDGPPPTELVVEDLTVGDGTEATAGTTCTMQYVGHSWSTGKQFDASWDRGEPFTFPLGAGHVIGGWDKGVAGMKVGRDRPERDARLRRGPAPRELTSSPGRRASLLRVT
jgi:peptidylprolyl isomerase